jgi:GNAT superfamily N-acetyltransferase
MSKYKIHELITSQDKKDFLDLASKLYKGCENWVRPLDTLIENIFDSSLNPLYENGESIRFLLKDENAKLVGRIAVFIDYHTCNTSNIKAGGCGFFECIDDYDAARLLFDEAKKWLSDREMEAMDGPINFGPRHENWGLLIEGDYLPNYSMPYNHFYYKDFFEKYGFKEYFQQYTYRTFLIEANLSPLVVWKAERLLKDTDYQVKMYSDVDKSRVVDDFVRVYNEAWVGDVPGVESMSKRDGESLYRQLRKILDPRLMYFAYYKERPIGFFIMMPDINPIIQKMKGRDDIIGKLKYFYYSNISKPSKAIGQIFGVVPDFQSRGVDAALIYKFAQIAFRENFQYDVLEMNWIGDFNPRMMHLMEYIGAEKYKTHATYRNIFDSSREFVSCPKI